MNRELGADFDPDAFAHRAALGRRGPAGSRCTWWPSSDQTVTVAGWTTSSVRFRAGEHLRTEISTKFTPDGMAAELVGAGLAVRRQWTDDAGDFLLTLARPA